MLYPTKTKDPAATLDYKFDWGSHGGRRPPWLQDGEAIASYTVTAPPGITLTEDTLVEANRSVVVWLSGGTAGQTYVITCRITTNAQRTDVRRLAVHIQER